MDANEVKAIFREQILQFIQEYREQQKLITTWQEPILGFADANGAYVKGLKETVSATHYLPQDFLPDCTVVLCYYLPFTPEIGHSNDAGEEPSSVWVTAYNETNQMFLRINEHLTKQIEAWGFQAVTPQPVGTIDENHIYSNWSQRHLAYAAGLGTFGINNMLITEKGTCGRFYSLITNLPVEADRPLETERCLYKSKKICGLCAKRCPIQALNPEGTFDRASCFARLSGFERRLGADVCGKCLVGLPCTYENPGAR